MELWLRAVRHRRTHAWVGRLTADGGKRLALAFLIAAAGMYLWRGEVAWQRLNLTNLVFDFYQRLAPRPVSRFPVAIIDIDDESLAAIGRWPWPRPRIARLVEASHRLGARAIGLDMIMPEADSQSPLAILAERSDTTPSLRAAVAALLSNDAILADSLRRVAAVIGRAATNEVSGRESSSSQTPVITTGEAPGQFLNKNQQFVGQLSNIPEIEAAARGHGYLNDGRDRDGIVRFMPVVLAVNDTLAPSMALELVRVAARQRTYQIVSDKSGITGIHIGDLFVPTDQDGRLRLYFSPAYGQRRVSAAKILRGETAPGALAEQIAIIGISAVGVGDLAATPVTARMDGVEIQAQMVENILLGTRLLRPWSARVTETSALLVFGLILIFMLPRHSPLTGALMFFAGAVLLVFLSYGAFRSLRTLYDPTFPIAANSAVVLLLFAAGLTKAEQLRRASEAALQDARNESLKMMGELRAAGKIQKGMLPDPRNIDGLPAALDFFAMLEPAQEVGGDLYDAFMLDQRRLCFMIGDVSDKGVPASLFMAMTKTLCKSLARRENIPLDRLLHLLNNEVSTDNPESMFVSAIIGIADSETGEVELCNAGHPPPIVLRPEQPALSLDEAGGPPLCIDESFLYVSQRITLEPGAALLLVTDGVTEAQNRERDCYGLSKLLGFTVPARLTAEGICEKLYAEVDRFGAGAPLADDLTIVALRFTPSRAAEL